MQHSFYRTHQIQPRIAIYPWCDENFEEPARIIKQSGLADQIIFCDIKRIPKSFYDLDQKALGIPCTYFQGYIYEDLDRLPVFDVLFYPSSGRPNLEKILNKMAVKNAYIITRSGKSITTPSYPFLYNQTYTLPNYPKMQVIALRWSETSTNTDSKLFHRR